MTDHSPTPGDTVKLVGKANPDNVLYGVIDTVCSSWWDFTIDKTDESIAPNKGDWTITPWTRPVTFKPFAVVRLPEGWNEHIIEKFPRPYRQAAVTRNNAGVWSDGEFDSITDEEVALLLNHGAEILFAGVAKEGVDE